MMTPGFSAETSLYQSGLTYYGLGIAAGSAHQSVRPAQDSCTCTSPDCTWSCPPPDPCDTKCGGISDRCKRNDCYCACLGGKIQRDQRPPCYRHCVGLP
jgi:hypothetical protein